MAFVDVHGREPWALARCHVPAGGHAGGATVQPGDLDDDRVALGAIAALSDLVDRGVRECPENCIPQVRPIPLPQGQVGFEDTRLVTAVLVVGAQSVSVQLRLGDPRAACIREVLRPWIRDRLHPAPWHRQLPEHPQSRTLWRA